MSTYGDIKIVLPTPEAVRKRPGMYFGDLDEAPTNAIWELVANAIDQFLIGTVSAVTITINDDEICVSDNGQGMPFEKEAPNDGNGSFVEHVLTHWHDTPTADQHAPHIHATYHGVGLACLNAVTASLDIDSSNGEVRYRQSFGQGSILSECTKETGNFEPGTSITMILDPDIFKGHRPDLYRLRKDLFEMIHLYPGLAVELNGERFYAEHGLLDLAAINYKRSDGEWFDTPKRFWFKGDTEEYGIQVAAIGDTKAETEFLSWVNGCETVKHGAHVEGLKQALVAVGWKPTLALIHVVMFEPRFAGPVKDKLVVDDVVEGVSQALKAPLDDFIERNNE